MIKKKILKIGGYSLGALALASLAGIVITGWQIGWGPFGFLHNCSGEVRVIIKKYNAENQKNEIVFYGASNFRLWERMDNDLAEYKVQNHGFGGSTDKLLVSCAEQLLYPYEPDVVVFQTGSNDYVGLSGADDEKVRICMEYKREMFETFHNQLPDAKFIVMSGLLLPGRSEYTGLTQQINAELKALCDEREYMVFVDASGMTYDGVGFAEELFERDGIHLNREGQRKWCEEYIRPALESLITAFELEHLRK